MRSVIIFFSNSGITEKLAKRIRKDTDSDIIKVLPENEYGGYVVSIVKMIKEKITKNTTRFINDIPDLSEKDTVFVGYPIWGGGVPQILLDYLSECDLSGKQIIPFSTAGASSIKGSLKKLKEVCKGGKIKYPFSVTKKNRGNYESWINKIRSAG